MCGICGELQFLDAPARDDRVIAHLSQLMARRGPDDSGVWRDGRQAWLAFRRLAILDLSPAGHQPMLSHDERYALVFNGEVYNYQELRRLLENKGVRFRSTGDTEVVLYALIHWGIEALDRFNGMFALGFYDRQERSLLLARDHAGIKPLYHLQTDEGVFFASQFDQILAHPWRRGLAISNEGLALYLRLGYVPAPYSILDQVEMLLPGSWLRVTAEGRKQAGTYYRFPVFAEADLHGVEAYEAVDEAVTQAINRQMISDVPLGSFLSGGIDSPLVTARAQSVHRSTLKAFTIGSDGSRYDETDEATAYAREIGVEHVVEQFTPTRVLDALDDVVAAVTEPLADYSIFPTLLVSQMARREVTVVLSGDGGDELFWGYAGRFGSVLSTAAAFRRPMWWRGAQYGAARYLSWGDGHENLRYPTIGDWYKEKHTRIPEAWLQTIFLDPPGLPSQFGMFEYDGWEADRTAQWLRWNEFVGHLTMVLLKVDRASMYNSLEVRVPLLDRQVIEVGSRIAWDSCLDYETRVGKMPLRNALARHTSAQTHAKRGFAVPMDAWFRGPLYDVFQDIMLSRRDLLGLPLNREGLQQMLAEHLRSQTEYGYSLWSLLSLALWADRYMKPVSPRGTELSDLVTTAD